MFISDLLEVFDDFCVYYENQYIKIFKFADYFCIFQKETKKFLRGARDIEEIKNEYSYSEYTQKRIYEIGVFRLVIGLETISRTHNFIVSDIMSREQLVSERGEFLLPKYVNRICNDWCGFRIVEYDGHRKMNAVDTIGHFVFSIDNSFLYISDVFSNGFFVVKTARGFNLANTDGRLILDKYYDDLVWVGNGFIGHQNGRGFISIDNKGQITSNVWHLHYLDAAMEINGKT